MTSSPLRQFHFGYMIQHDTTWNDTTIKPSYTILNIGLSMKVLETIICWPVPSTAHHLVWWCIIFSWCTSLSRARRKKWWGMRYLWFKLRIHRTFTDNWKAVWISSSFPSGTELKSPFNTCVTIVTTRTPYNPSVSKRKKSTGPYSYNSLV